MDLETLWSQQPSLPPYMTEYRWESSSLNHHHDPCTCQSTLTQFKVNRIRIKASLMIFISRIRTEQLAQLPLRGNFFWKISCCRTFRTYAEYADIFKNLLQKKWWTWWSYGLFRRMTYPMALSHMTQCNQEQGPEMVIHHPHTTSVMQPAYMKNSSS